MPPSLPLAATSLALLALGACAAEPAAPPIGMAVMVKLAQPGADATAIATMVSDTTARPARYQSATSQQWHAVAVACRGTADCELALRRLREDTTHFEAVQRDERKRIVSP